MQQLMTLSGWDVSRSQGSDTWLLPIPATFVVGTDGKSRFRPRHRSASWPDLIATLKCALTLGTGRGRRTGAVE
jgi:hypothetical protein